MTSKRLSKGWVTLLTWTSSGYFRTSNTFSKLSNITYQGVSWTFSSSSIVSILVSTTLIGTGLALESGLALLSKSGVAYEDFLFLDFWDLLGGFMSGSLIDGWKVTLVL